jgi:hypothetical protein
MIMGWLRKTPVPLLVAIIVVVGVASIAYLGGFVYLTAIDKPTDDYVRLLNSSLNWVTLLLVGTGTAASVTAAKSASNAEDQTNGHLAEKDDRIAKLEQQVRRMTGGTQ